MTVRFCYTLTCPVVSGILDSVDTSTRTRKIIEAINHSERVDYWLHDRSSAKGCFKFA